MKGGKNHQNNLLDITQFKPQHLFFLHRKNGFVILIYKFKYIYVYRPYKYLTIKYKFTTDIIGKSVLTLQKKSIKKRSLFF